VTAERTSVVLLAHAVSETGGMAGGMERACVELIRLGHDEFDFTVISSELAPDLRGLVEWRRIRLPQRPAVLRVLTFFFVAGFWLRKVDADVRHTVGAIVPNTVSIATVHHCHAGFQAKTGRRAPRDAPLLRRLNTTLHRFVAQLAERWAYRPKRIEYLAAVSSGVADELHEHFPGIDVVVTPNGVDVERFGKDPQVRAEFREELGLLEDDLVALFVGGDWPHKGLGIAIDAVGLAQREGVPIQLWVVGSGDERRFAKLAASAGVGNNVRFFGQREDTERFYAGADILVLPSSYETFSLVAYEAAAASMPVVATAVSGVTELVDGGGGVLVEPTARSVSAALQLLARDDALRTSMGEAGRRRARAFTWEASANGTFEVYRRVANVSNGLSSPVSSVGAVQ
jgi:glycosyltransferase involved in cell wall biosynthesis